MLHKLLAGHRSHIRSILSIMLCLALICGTVASMSVFAAEPQTEIELATETVAEVSESSETAAEAATEAQTTTEAQTAASTEAASEVATEAVTETVTEGVTETATEAVTETATEGTTETAAEEATEKVAESTTEAESEATSESTTEETTETAMPAVTLEGSADGVNVTVSAPEGAFAAGVTMVVSAVDVEAFEEAVLEDCEALGDNYTVYDSAAVEISFYDSDNKEVQPATEVEVTLSGLDLVTENEDGGAEYALIYHMDDDGNVEWIEDQDPGQESYTFTASSFSTYGVVNVSVEYGIELTAPGDNNNTVDHIDIGITVTATLVINGEELTQKVTLTTSDFTSDTVTLTAAYSNGTAYTGFTMNLDDLESSKGADGTTQVRVGGSYYVGTQSNPVYYTFSLTKDVTFTDSNGNEYTVTMTFTATFSYWDDDNNCPVLSNWTGNNKQFNQAAGMDFVLTSSTANRSIIQIYKYVYDENGDLITGNDVAGTSYSFTIYDSSGSAVETATVTVGSGGIGYYSTDVTAGTYYLVETNYASAVGDKNYTTTNTSATYTPSNGDPSTSTSDSRTTATMTVNSSGTTIYTINNYYAPSTTSITIEKEVTGNMGDTTKEFTFTLTDADGKAVGTDESGDSISSFTLADGGSQTIYGLTIGSTVYLTESENTGYTVTVTDADGNTIEAENGKYAITVGSGVTITVTNDKNVTPDTGITLDTAPYIAILFGVVLFGTVALIRRRKRLL